MGVQNCGGIFAANDPEISQTTPRPPEHKEARPSSRALMPAFVHSGLVLLRHRASEKERLKQEQKMSPYLPPGRPSKKYSSRLPTNTTGLPFPLFTHSVDAKKSRRARHKKKNKNLTSGPRSKNTIYANRTRKKNQKQHKQDSTGYIAFD